MGQKTSPIGLRVGHTRKWSQVGTSFLTSYAAHPRTLGRTPSFLQAGLGRKEILTRLLGRRNLPTTVQATNPRRRSVKRSSRKNERRNTRTILSRRRRKRTGGRLALLLLYTPNLFI